MIFIMHMLTIIINVNVPIRQQLKMENVIVNVDKYNIRIFLLIVSNVLKIVGNLLQRNLNLLQYKIEFVIV